MIDEVLSTQDNIDDFVYSIFSLFKHYSCKNFEK